MRKIIQIAVVPEGDDERLYALTDDRCVFTLLDPYSDRHDWRLVQSIPQDNYEQRGKQTKKAAA